LCGNEWDAKIGAALVPKESAAPISSVPKVPEESGPLFLQ